MSDANHEGRREAAAEARDGQLHPVRPALTISKPSTTIVFILNWLSHQLFIIRIHDDIALLLITIDEHPCNSLGFPVVACSFACDRKPGEPPEILKETLSQHSGGDAAASSDDGSIMSPAPRRTKDLTVSPHHHRCSSLLIATHYGCLNASVEQLVIV